MGESFTIQISSNLVKQLADEGEKLKKKTRKPKTKTPPSQKSQPKGPQKLISGDPVTLQGSTTPNWPLQPPVYLPVPPAQQSDNAELDAIRSVLQESEKVVERLKKQEDEMLQEVTKRAKDLRDKEFKLPYQKPMPCLAENDACRDCYKENANDPLKCSNLVNNFVDCVSRFRQKGHSKEN